MTVVTQHAYFLHVYHCQDTTNLDKNQR